MKTTTWAAWGAAALATAALVGLVALRQLGPSAPSVATLDPNEPFALVECKARSFDGSPAIAAVFTQPLNRKQNWAQLVQTTLGADAKPHENRWLLSDNPRVLILPHVGPNQTFRMQFNAKLEDAGAHALGKEVSCEAKSDEMGEAHYFASRGVVLPAGQNGGLPVVTVNTPEVDVQFLRIKDEALPNFLEQVGSGNRTVAHDNEKEGENEGDGEGDYYSDSASRKLKGSVSRYRLNELKDLSTPVYLSRFTTDSRPNRRNVSFLPVENIPALQEPGIYVAVMSKPGQFDYDHQVTYFYVTDIGLHVRQHATQTDVFTTSLKSGEAIRGVSLSVVDDSGKSLAQVTSDGDGHAVLKGHTGKARAIVARKSKEISVIALRDPALDLSEFDIGGHRYSANKLFMYSGRDLYRPGERFEVSLLARDPDGQATASPAPVTFTLKQPNGDVVTTQLVKPHGKGQGYYQHTVQLAAGAATGAWTLEARLDPSSKRADTSWPFKVEEFLPERMKLDLKASDAVLTGSGSLSVEVQGNYLYGAPAAGNTVQVSAYSERLAQALPKEWPGFLFGDVEDDTARKREDLGSHELDDQGNHSYDIPVEFAERASPMRVRTSVSLQESGGRPVVRSLERIWWPAKQLVGIRPLFANQVTAEGSLAGFELVRVNTQGQLAPAKAIKVKLIREDRYWYWRYDDSRGWHGSYTTDEEPVDTRSMALDKRTTLNVPVNYGRYRLEVTDPDTQLTARYRFYAGWGAQDADDTGNRPDRVALKLEGAPYKEGDKAKLTITPPHDGEALITVEGDRVLYQTRQKVKISGTQVSIPIDRSWNRHDLYVTVAVFRPGSQGDKVTPARALGLTHLPITRENRKLKLALTAPAKTTPEQTVPVKVKVTDAQGQPLKAGSSAVVTLSAVDVGILNITNYATPSPLDFFFGKHRYDADLLDIYGKLIEKMDGNTARHRFGGDAGMRDTQSMPRKVKLVDIFSGPVSLNDQGEASIPVALPDFNGTLRLMAVASTADSYASASADMVVAAPIVAELSMPRFISPGDTATLALDVTNLSGAAQTVNVQVSAEKPLRITSNLSPIKLADQQRQILRLQAEATDAYGLAPIKVTVTAGAFKVVREAALQVQPVTPLVRESRRVRLEPQGTYKVDQALLDAYWAGSAHAQLTLSNKPPLDVKSAVQGLLMYPYGCLEQTTSSAYPLVFIDEESAKAFGMKPLSREERAQRLETAFGRLSGMQQASGGFGLWSASSPYEAWLSAYVTGFLQDAHDAGFAVPDHLRTKALNALLEQFQRSPGLQVGVPKDLTPETLRKTNDYRQIEVVRTAHLRLAEAAHAGYVLAKAQKAPLATLRSLYEHRGNARSPLALIHLGVALKLMGDDKRATTALDEAMSLGYGLMGGVSAADGGRWWDEWLGDYGSRVRDLALGYAVVQRHDIRLPKAEELLYSLASDFDQRNHLSTQERLALFLAARAAGGSGEARPWAANLKVGTGTNSPLNADRTAQRALTAAEVKAGVTLTNTSNQALYLEVSGEGYPTKPLAARDDRIALERSWFTADGKPLTSRTLKTGDMVLVRLTARPTQQRIKDALVVDRVPAGMEVENLNISQGPQASEFVVDGVNLATAMSNERIKHREFRDDRFVAAVDLSDKMQLFYMLRVVTPGKYTVPAAFAEDMYRPDIRGIGRPEEGVTVVDPRAK